MLKDQRRMGTRLGGWVEAVGVRWVTDGLGVSHQTVYRWLAGERVPTLEHADRIARLSGGAITLQDVVEHGKEVRSARIGDERR